MNCPSASGGETRSTIRAVVPRVYTHVHKSQHNSQAKCCVHASTLTSRHLPRCPSSRPTALPRPVRCLGDRLFLHGADGMCCRTLKRETVTSPVEKQCKTSHLVSSKRVALATTKRRDDGCSKGPCRPCSSHSSLQNPTAPQ